MAAFGHRTIMRSVVIVRYETGPQGTFSNVITDSGFECKGAELPWNDNKPDVSCVPDGLYKGNKRWSETHQQKLYHIDGIAGRSNIEIHSGNFAGDTSKGFRSDVRGCLVLGSDVGQLNGQKVVTGSKAALAMFEHDLKDEDCDIMIRWNIGMKPVKLGGTV